MGHEGRVLKSGTGDLMRGFLRALAGIVVVVALVWAGLWWYAQARLQAALKLYASELTSPDGTTSMSYDGISGGGFPLAATATLNNPRLTIALPGNDMPSPLVLGMSHVTLRVGVLDPLVLHLDMPDKITGHVPQGDGAVTFGKFSATATLNRQALFNPNIFPISAENADISDINVLGSSGSIQVLHIDRLHMHETLNPAANAGQTSLTLAEDLQGVALPDWMTKILGVPFDGKIEHLGLNASFSGALDWVGLAQQLKAQTDENAKTQLLVNAAHGWAKQGGNATAALSVTLGPSTLNASGDVKFDANAQPSGQAEVTANHLDALTSAIAAAYPSTQNDINQAEAQLAPYLSADRDNGQVLNIHATYGASGVMVNGQKMADMPPLDWNELTSLFTPQASGDGAAAPQGSGP